MPYRITYGYSQNVWKAGGWTENFWSLKTTLADAIAVANGLRPLLVKIHGTRSEMNFQRVRSVEPPREHNLKHFPDPEVSSMAEKSDYPTNALVLESRSNLGYNTRQWFRGVQDSAIVDGFYRPSAPYKTAVNKLIAYLADPDNAFAIRLQNPLILTTPITNISNGGVVTAPAHGLDTGARVKIGKVISPFAANGVKRITVVDVDTFTIDGWVAPSPAQTFDGPNAYVLFQTKGFYGIAEAEVLYASKHDVGRPPQVLTGRRKTRRR